MPYGTRTLIRIKAGICIDCQNGDAGKYRRCFSCRQKAAVAQRKRYSAGRKWMPGAKRIRSYTTAKERGLI